MRVFSILFFCVLSVSLAKTLPTKDITTVDIVINGLKDHSWSKLEEPCLEQTLLILNNVRNYTVWAVWIWNSMHSPVGIFYGSENSLGNYDQCLNAPSISTDPKIVTQYCLTEVRLTGKKYQESRRNVLGSTEPYISTKSNISRDLNKVIWGACLPSTCKAGSISKILKTVYLANPLTPSEPEIIVDNCQEAGKKIDYSFGFYAFMTLIVTLVVLSIISTYYLEHYKTKCGVINGVADSFSLKRNWKSFTKNPGEEIGILNLIKIGQAALAVSAHTALFEVMGPISNGGRIDEFMLDTENPLKNFVKHIDLPVDNFFMVSGLLLVKGLMEKKKKPLVALINRYFRLTASFSVIMFYVASVSMYTGDGPVWQKFASREQKACAENWWLGLLMLNNYVNSGNICLMVSWYIPCDYQLAIMGTILFLLWQKNTAMGKVVTTITVVLAFLTPGLVTYWRRLPGLLLYHDLEKIMDFRKNEVFLDTYIRSHNRAGPFIIGMAMGYIISVYKPDRYRNTISKKTSLLLLAVASIVSYRVATNPLSWVTLEYDHLSSAVYAVASRNLWSLAMCVTIGIVEYGEFDSVRQLTRWQGFTIISRLTFGIYLTHSLILQQNNYSRRNLQQFDFVYSQTVRSFGVMVMSGIVATLLWFFVETPLNNIANLFINSGSKHQLCKQRTKDEKEATCFKEDEKIK